MKFKKIMLVTIVLLAILTMGAVSASEDVASDDDGLAVIEEDASIDAPVEEVETDEVLSSPYEENGFDPIFENEVNLDSDEPVIDINTPDEGNFSISVDDGEETNVFNHEINEDDVETGYICWTLDDLEITETGTYFITAKFISPSGDETTILDNQELMVFSDATDGVVIWVGEREFDLNNQDDLDAPFAYVSVSNEFLKSNVIRMWDEDQEDNGGCIFFEKSLSEITNYQPDNENEDFTVYFISLSNFEDRLDNLLSLKHLKIEFFDVDENDNYMEIDSRSYNVEYDDDESTVRFWEVADEDDDEDDAADGVVIWVDDEMEFDLNNQEDLNTPFAFVSVQNDINGRIVFFIWNEEEGDEQELFGFDLEDITNREEDLDNEGFTIYKISLNDLEGYEDLIECGGFKLAFLDDDDEIDSRNYDIDYDDEEGIVTFWESDDDEEDEMHGEGDEIEAEFTNANILDNGVVVTFSTDDDVLPDYVDTDFTVIILHDDDEPKEITLNLDDIREGDNYVIRVNDLQLPEFKERYDILMILQFYVEFAPSFYAEWMDDDEPIHIFESPCIFNETSLLNDDDVITIQEIPEGVDEFTVIISKDGMDDIVKTFKFSELVEDEEDVWVALKLADLGITETGEYEITVKYSDDLTYSGDLIVTRDVDIRTHVFEEDGYLKTFESVDELVANLRISERVTGYVKLYVNGTQVGGNINFADLRLGTVPPDDGRQIILNDLNITESGMYKVKLEVYSDDELLGETEFSIRVEVGENSVNIIEEAYPYGTEANDEVIEYIIGAPLSDGQYFNIYFNGTKAGVITANGLEFNDEFTVPMFDVILFKPGNYDVNVTFFDGETETDVTTGSFSINELALTKDKESYILDEDHAIISFYVGSLDDDDSVRAYYVYDWGPVGRDDSMIFNPYGGKEMKEDGLYKDGFVLFDVAWIEDEEGNEHFRLDEGTTLIYVVYKHGEERFGGFIEVNVVDPLERVDPELTIDVTNVTEGSAAVVTITTNETFSGAVLVQIGDSNYTVAVTNGKGSLPVSGLDVGNHTAVATFKATAKFTESVKNTTFSVKAKLATSIKATAVTTTYGTSKNIIITLTDENGNALAGKKVTVVLNGAKKVLTTDANGKASYAVGNKLAVKTYVASITFDGDAFYAKSTGSAKVVVKKATPKLTAKKKTFKVKKAKKYGIVLKTDKGKALAKVKVTLTGKFKGKKIKITVKTSSKGKATFNLKKLTKKGKFTATVKFAGNKYYNAATKKAKITIK